MPATMMHLLAGSRLVLSPTDAFLLGTILPDCLDGDRAKKDHLHLRDIPPEERKDALIRLGKELDLKKDFDRGAFFHLYLDYLWDNGPQAEHRRNYRGNSWFLDYRKELKKAGSRSYLYMENGKAVWERLRAPDPALFQSVLALPEEEAFLFLDFNCNFHTKERLGESEIFTDQVVLSFIEDSLHSFQGFLAEFFPEEISYFTFA